MSLAWDIHGIPCISPCQTAEIGSWLNKHGSIAAVDKELDGNPERNHVFLQHRAALLEMKVKDPKGRVTARNNPIKELIGISEEKKVGIRAPKVKWMESKSFKKRYGTLKESENPNHRRKIGDKSRLCLARGSYMTHMNLPLPNRTHTQ